MKGCVARCRQLYRHGRSKSARQRGPPPPRHQGSIWCLPEELLLHLLKRLHITDLLSMRSTHPTFRDLIDQHVMVWSSARFTDTWPTLPNMKHFNRAAEAGNVESLIKLGIAYLYNEGLPSDFQGKKVTTNGEHAATMFCKVETLLSHVTPFTWLFIRPPWAALGACCKECVFRNMKEYTLKYDVPNVTVCVAKTLQLLEDEELQAEAVVFLEQATSRGSPHAAYLLWQHKYGKQMSDAATELEAVRELRQIAKLRDQDAVLQLCTLYVKRRYGGMEEGQAMAYVRNFIQSSQPTRVQEIYKQSELTHSMRYILVDWLVEVAGIKDFGSTTLHAAISVVDRFLRSHQTSRQRFQLLGVAAMVLCSRFLGKDIITIREAAWLTDNTYKYEDVVRMMGEIIATLNGNIRVWCTLDYVQLIGLLACNDEATQCLAEYICELALLQSQLGTYRQAELAAAAVLLARLTTKKEFPWPQQMVQFTGFTVADLANCTLHVHEKCFNESAMVDHRAVILQAVKQRYADSQFHRVSTITVLPTGELRASLGVLPSTPNTPSSKSDAKVMAPDLIMSPSRNKDGHAHRPCRMSVEREQAATPTLEQMERSLEAPLDMSLLSGYDADLEDELDSFMEEVSDAESMLCSEDSMSVIFPHQFENSGSSSPSTSLLSPPSMLMPAPVSTSTPSIRINLPSFGFQTSSPVTVLNPAAAATSTPMASPVSRPWAGHSSLRKGTISCLLSTGARQNANISHLRVPSGSSSSGSTVQATSQDKSSQHTSFSSPSPSSSSTVSCREVPALPARKDMSLGFDNGVDSGIDLMASIFDQSNSVLEPSRSSVSCPGGGHSSSISHNTGLTKPGRKERKRRNSGQLGNENKTHVISL